VGQRGAIDDPVSGVVIGAAIRIHWGVGPGLLESVYERVLGFELEQLGLDVARQVPIGLSWGPMSFPTAYRVDLLVEGRLVVEVKAIETVLPVHRAQLLSYLKLGRYPTGLLINFHVEVLKDGLTRLWCSPPSPPPVAVNSNEDPT
jgi:GxxExxY protein